MKRYLLPLAVFLVLAGFLAVGLKRDPHEIPSPLINKPAPAFKLPRLDAPTQMVSTDDLHGQVWMLNVWASWCVACRQEHPLLVDLARSGTVKVYGLNYKDQPADAIGLLQKSGNPYVLSVSDTDGRVGIDYGVYGTPETYLIDRQGVIRFKHVGPLNPQVVERTLLPLIEKLRAS